MAYHEGMPETPLITYLRIQQATDRRVLQAVRRAASDVDLELRRLQGRSGVGAAMRREQLVRSQAAINRRLERLFSDVGDVTQAGRASAAAAGAESVLRESESLLKRMMSDEDYRYLVESARASAEQSIEVMLQRVHGSSYVPLAQSVWGNQARANATVGKLVESALARGDSAADLAKAVRGYVNPNTPGGVRYASMRLARSEINNAFHAAQVKQAQEEPWTDSVRWHLSGSHPKPDECNDYADSVHFKGGEPGMWLPDEVPVKPHPNCLCYTTPETMSPEDFVNSYLDGRFDPYLEQMDMPDEVLSDVVQPPGTDIHRVGSAELAQRMAAAERQRQTLEQAKFITKGRGKGNYNPETGYSGGGARALSDYTEAANGPMNLLKRDPDRFMEEWGKDDFWLEHISEQNRILEDMLSKNAIQDDITVARHMTGSFGDLKEGSYMADPGFLSTTTDSAAFTSAPSQAFREALEAGQEDWTFIIQAPKGTPALPGADYQKEIVFGPGTRQRIAYVDKETRTIYTEIV